MENVLLVVHLIACLSMVGVVLLQRSEGGALSGLGGGGNGGLISGRGAAQGLMRTTMILAAVFFVTSLALTRINSEQERQKSDVERQLEQLKDATPLPAPTTETPAAAVPAPTQPAPAEAAAPASETAPAAPAAPANSGTPVDSAAGQ